MQEVEVKRHSEIRRIIVESNANLEEMVRHEVPIAIRYKKTCVDLMAIASFLRFGLLRCEQLKFLLELCLKNIKILVQQIQTQKYGHKFPLFSYVINRFERSLKQKLEINKKLTQTSKITLPEEPVKNIQYHPLLPISRRQLSLLKQQKVSDFLLDVQNNEQILQNPICLGCSQALTKDQQISHTNQYFPRIVFLTGQEYIQKITLQRYINSVCNQGGGIILIGSENKLGGIGGVTGIKYRSYQQIILRSQQLITTFKNVRPPCLYEVQTLFVHTNYCQVAKVADQYLRVCFRLKVFPRRADQISYLEFSSKGYQSVYEIYELNSLREPQKILRNEKLYTNLYQKYYKKNFKNPNQHQNVSCFRSLQKYSKIFNEKIKSGQLTQQDLINSTTKQIEENQTTTKIDDPNFVYSHTSLLAVGAQKDNRHIQQFIKYLKKCKEDVVLSKPFSESFKNCSRSIWMLSHKRTIAQINDYLTNCTALKIIPVGLIYVIPVQKMLQIQRSKLLQHQEKTIERRIKQRYKEAYKTQTAIVIQKNKEKQIFYMIFNDFAQAIYAYLSFEQLHLRPYFVRQNSLNKIKPKKTLFNKNVDY